MLLKNIELKNYRNYDTISVEFGKNLNVIIGDNAQGKTNLLESIYVLAVTKSFLSISDKKLLKFNNKFSLIHGMVQKEKKIDKYEVIINEKEKKVKINDKEIKRISDYISKINVVVFFTDNIRIFKESPSLRRRYFNIQISQIDNNYLKLLNDYNVILKQRNEFFKIIDINKNSNLQYMEIINKKYIDISIKIYECRKKYIDSINKYLFDYFNKITDISNLKLLYTSNCEDTYENFEEKLKRMSNQELQYKTTLIGPNRDDFYFVINNKDLSLYGSQGQFRSAILSLKMSELEVFKDITGENPIFLLDDIFSELDINKKNRILKLLNMDIQTIITTTDVENISNDILKKANIYKIKDGKIISQEIIK